MSMKGGKILLAALVLTIAGIGCSKPPEGTTYVPPPNVQTPKMGTLYLGNNSSVGMDFYINNRFIKFIDGGTYFKKDYPPGEYEIKAVQAEKIKAGQAPKEYKYSATVVADKMIIVTLP